MNLRNALRFIAFLSVVFGIGFATLPGLVFAPYGVHLDSTGTFVARLFGASNIGFAVALWAGSAQGEQAQRALAWGVIAYSVVEGIATAAAVLGGLANVLACGFVLLDVIFIAACVALMRPATPAPTRAAAAAD